MRKLRLLFGVHNHQPLGNFDGVIQGLVEKAYRPFLEALKAFPPLKIALHVSGPLFLWLEEKDPAYLDAVGELVSRGQVELLLGGLFEPILTAIPRQDRLGQLHLMRERLEGRFGVKVRGAWLTERAFEPQIIEDLIEVDVEYFLMDDRPFLASGFTKEELYHYFVTEEGGKCLFVFPIDQELRYLIPFRTPEAIEAYFRKIHEAGKPLAIFGDDGEKFGGWPGTREWVYERGWLKGFFEVLEQLMEEFLESATFAETLKTLPPAGLCYLLTSSYMEMEEWSLPPGRALELRALKERLGGEAERFAPFVRGGHWRNFLRRYPEANLAHKKMLALSRMLQEKGSGGEARIQLYAAQCNDAYWHGVFGGLYLPHLRHEIWRHLSRAEGLLRKGEGLQIESFDLDLDGREEIWVHSSRFSSILKPHEGGRLVEYTLFPYETNYLNVLTRRFEAYHIAISHQPSAISPQPSDQGVPSIHELQKGADINVRDELFYDAHGRGSFVDGLFREASFQEFIRGTLQDLGAFSTAPFSWEAEGSTVRLQRKGSLDGEGQRELLLTKTFTFSLKGGIKALYELKNLGDGLEATFGVEFNLFFASMALGGGWMEVKGGRYPILEELDLDEVPGVLFFDEAAGAKLELNWGKAARLFAFPVRTISQSERGFERTPQGLALLPHWRIAVPEGGRWEVAIRWRWR